MFGNPGNGNQIRGNGNSHDWHMICRISLVNDEIPPGKELTFQNCRNKQKIYEVIPPGKKLTFQNCRNKQKIYELIPPGKKLTFQNCRNKQKIYEVILS